MNKNIFFAIVVTLVILGGLTIFLANSNSKPTETLQNSNTQESQESTKPTVEEVKKITLIDIAKHNLETDCWMAINDKVYDVTGFIPTHPGGKAIIGGCGKDASTLFNERPTNSKGPHPKQAMELLPKFEIGVLIK